MCFQNSLSTRITFFAILSKCNDFQNFCNQHSVLTLHMFFSSFAEWCEGTKNIKKKKENDACVLLGNFFFTSNNHNFLFFFGIILNIFHSPGTCFCKEVDVCHVRTRISVSAHVLLIIECTSLVLLDHRSLPLHHCSLSTHSRIVSSSVLLYIWLRVMVCVLTDIPFSNKSQTSML